MKLNPGKSIQNAPMTDADLVNLEHILPKNPNQDWKDLLASDNDIVADCLNRLGNLCLLDKPSNKKEATSAFSKKVGVYRESDFHLTNDVAQRYSEWNRAEIENRQQELASLAVERWKA